MNPILRDMTGKNRQAYEGKVEYFETVISLRLYENKEHVEHERDRQSLMRLSILPTAQGIFMRSALLSSSLTAGRCSSPNAMKKQTMVKQ